MAGHARRQGARRPGRARSQRAGRAGAPCAGVWRRAVLTPRPCHAPRPPTLAVIFNGKELYDVMVERCGPSKTSGPKA